MLLVCIGCMFKEAIGNKSYRFLGLNSRSTGSEEEEFVVVVAIMDWSNKDGNGVGMWLVVDDWEDNGESGSINDGSECKSSGGVICGDDKLVEIIGLELKDNWEEDLEIVDLCLHIDNRCW